MLEVMLRGGQHVDLPTYDAAVDACWASGVAGLQRYALALLERARGQGLFQVLLSEQVRGGTTAAAAAAACDAPCLLCPGCGCVLASWH